MSGVASARRAALFGVLHFLFGCFAPMVPETAAGYHRALVGTHVNSMALAAMQVGVGLSIPLMALPANLASILELLLATGTTAGGLGYFIGGVTGNMSPLTKTLNAAGTPGPKYIGPDCAMHVLLMFVAAPAILASLALAAYGLFMGMSAPAPATGGRKKAT